MAPLQLCVFVLLVISFQEKKGVWAERKLRVTQTTGENPNLPALRRFADLGDPCAAIPNPDPYVSSNIRQYADVECNTAVLGYAGLPWRAQKRCRNPRDEGRCKRKQLTGAWQCELTATIDTRVLSVSRTVEDTIDLNYCIADLELDPLHRMQTIVTPSGSDRRVTVRQTEEENFFFPGLKTFAAGRDPCGTLRHRPEASELTKADAFCMNLVEGFKRLPSKAQYRCRDAHTPACKRDPYPADTYSCGMEIKVLKFFCLGTRTETVSLAYCIDVLDGLTSPPALPRTLRT